MKTTIMFIIFLIVFSCFLSPVLAEVTSISDFQIVKENDAIIKRVHARNGYIMGIPPYWGREITRKGFEPFVEFLGKLLEREIVLVILKDYNQTIKRTVAEQIDIGFYGPVLYLDTKKTYPGLRYVGTAVLKNTGNFRYYSYLISRKDSGIKRISDLKGKSFAFGSKESTSGYMYPLAWMKENNLDYTTYFNSIRFLGSHNQVLKSVATGDVDSGVVSPTPLNEALKQYGDVFYRMRKFGPIPASVLALWKKIPEKSIKRIQGAMDPLPIEISKYKQFKFMAFKKLSDSAYDQMRKVIQISRKYK